MIFACLFHAELLTSIGLATGVLAYAAGMRCRRRTAAGR